MSTATLRFLAPFAISAALLLLVVNSIRGEASQLTDALASADWRLIARPHLGQWGIPTEE